MRRLCLLLPKRRTNGYEVWCQYKFGKGQRMSIGTHLKLDIRTSYLLSTPIIDLKLFEKRQLFSNLPVNWANLLVNSNQKISFEFTGKFAQFTGKFEKSCLFSKSFKSIIGV